MNEKLQYLLEKSEETGLTYKERQELNLLLDMEADINWRDR